MMYIILFFMPALISLGIKDKYFKERLNLKEYIFLYAKYNILINIVGLNITFLYSLGRVTAINYIVNTISFCFKYLIIVIIMCFLAPIIYEYIDRNVDVKIRIIKQVNKNEKKKNSK